MASEYHDIEVDNGGEFKNAYSGDSLDYVLYDDDGNEFNLAITGQLLEDNILEIKTIELKTIKAK